MTEPIKPLWVFCTACQKDVARETGAYRITAKGWRRFVCASCIKMMSDRRKAA